MVFEERGTAFFILKDYQGVEKEFPMALSSHREQIPQIYGSNGVANDILFWRYHNNTFAVNCQKGDIPVAKTTKIGRDAGTGKFILVKEAQKHPKTSVVETIKKK